MDDRTFEELKDAYVLGALPDDERTAFESYLEAHPDRQAEIDDLGGLAGLLSLAPAQQEPPPDLRRRVMAVVESEAAPIERTRPARRAGRFGKVRDVALAAAAALLVGLVSWNVLLQGEVRDLRGQVEEARVAGENREVQLGGSWADQGVRAEVMSMDEDRAVLVVEDMPPMPEDRMLQVWVIHGDEPKPGGLLEPAGPMAATPITTPLKGADTLAVTVEPSGGSESPTTDPVLLTEL
jgi:anti-sigma-K factor RskA